MVLGLFQILRWWPGYRGACFLVCCILSSHGFHFLSSPAHFWSQVAFRRRSCRSLRLESYDRRQVNLCWQPVIALRNGLLDGSWQSLLGVPSWIISRPLQPFSHLAQQLSCGGCHISLPSHLSTTRCSGSGLGLLKMSRMKISLWTRQGLNMGMPIITDAIGRIDSAL